MDKKCKRCHCPEDDKTLICDMCEEVFHISCLKCKFKVEAVEDWYYPTCQTERKKCQLERKNFKLKGNNIVSIVEKNVHILIFLSKFLMRTWSTIPKFRLVVSTR